MSASLSFIPSFPVPTSPASLLYLRFGSYPHPLPFALCSSLVHASPLLSLLLLTALTLSTPWPTHTPPVLASTSSVLFSTTSAPTHPCLLHPKCLSVTLSTVCASFPSLSSLAITLSYSISPLYSLLILLSLLCYQLSLISSPLHSLFPITLLLSSHSFALIPSYCILLMVFLPASLTLAVRVLSTTHFMTLSYIPMKLPALPQPSTPSP